MQLNEQIQVSRVVKKPTSLKKKSNFKALVNPEIKSRKSDLQVFNAY